MMPVQLFYSVVSAWRSLLSFAPCAACSAVELQIDARSQIRAGFNRNMIGSTRPPVQANMQR